MLPDHWAFLCDSVTKINSYAAWSIPILMWQTHAAWLFSFLMWQTHMLPDPSAFSHDKLICCLIIQLSHVTNSYAVWLFSFLVRVLQKLTHAEWSIPILMWQTHMLPDHSAFSCDKLICCLIIQLTHVWVWEKNKLKSCLIIQLTHVWMWEKQTQMLPNHSAYSCVSVRKNKLKCCLIIQLTHVWVWEKQTQMLSDHSAYSYRYVSVRK